MARSINASTLTALQSDSFRYCHLLQINFSTIVYLTDYTHDITYNAVTYEAGGHLLNVANPQETRDLRVGSINITFSGVSQEYISIFLSQDFINRPVTLSKAVIGDDGQVVGAPIIIFNGLMSQFQIDDGDDDSPVTLQVASHWADFQRKAGRFTNNNSQQFYFSGDKGMEFAANSTKDIKWGRA